MTRDRLDEAEDASLSPNSTNNSADVASTPVAKGISGRRFATLLMAVVAAGVLGVLVWRERGALQQIDLRGMWPAIVIGQVVFVAGLALAAWIWGDIMRSMGSRVTMRRHINIYATTYLARLLPGTVWYVVGRGMLYQEEGEPARLSTVASGAEMLLTMMAGAAVAIVSGALLIVQSRETFAALTENLPGNGTVFSAIAFVALVAVIAAAILHPATQRWLLRQMRLSDTSPIRPQAAAKWMGLFAVNWLIGAAILYMNARALIADGDPLPMLWVLFVWSLVGTLSTFVFFLPTNFGLSEIGISLLLSVVMPSSLAVVAALLTRILQILYAAIGCAVLAAASTPRK